MEFNPACLINVFLAFLALGLYILGSYRFYKGQRQALLFLGMAIGIDVATAVLASFRITPTVVVAGAAAVPWYSLLFNVHVMLSTLGIVGFIGLFFYLLAKKGKAYSPRIRSWQFKVLLPIWVIGEGIALSNALAKIIFRVRLFEFL